MEIESRREQRGTSTFSTTKNNQERNKVIESMAGLNTRHSPVATKCETEQCSTSSGISERSTTLSCVLVVVRELLLPLPSPAPFSHGLTSTVLG